ncbi:MAG TPA: flagellar export chaperone FlgN [Fimbriimonadaceae bacterium]|nr:flagellar export chaperone FlgN [Fimbriimonadaceae bacterium]HRJ32513.1 flagellar export chaperone FlgN [Fimbriimonadaceae bacterium]
MKTKQLQTLWWDWLSTSERLLRSLHEQTAALTLRDVQRVERLQPELDQLMTRMKSLDDQAAAQAKDLAEELGAEPHLRGLVSVLEKAESQQVMAIANRVTVAARHVQEVMNKNQHLILNELDYVNGSLALIARVASEKQTLFRERPAMAAVLMDQVA